MEKLRNALFSLKGMSQKREHLEERLKTKMEAEIHELKSVIKGRRCSHNNGMLPDHLQLLEKDVKISNLEADLARVSHHSIIMHHHDRAGWYSRLMIHYLVWL